METGGCPHAAIREDASMNLEAIADLEALHPGFGAGFHRKRRRQSGRGLQSGSGGRFIYVIDVAGGDKIPRKGGPGITAKRCW